ncbi:hypothetical protein CEXT_401031 [Caerostris extrusa]|uniref:Uncharacterized protein n=1 Tax=Caerostris extrusa TaxID=172846 RepID=A0AAV4XK58_CAEEX|nr:hypothetical protein CEXT_401031 [Caerostris extrusa]
MKVYNKHKNTLAVYSVGDQIAMQRPQFGLKLRPKLLALMKLLLCSRITYLMSERLTPNLNAWLNEPNINLLRRCRHLQTVD